MYSKMAEYGDNHALRSRFVGVCRSCYQSAAVTENCMTLLVCESIMLAVHLWVAPSSTGVCRTPLIRSRRRVKGMRDVAVSESAFV